MDNPYATPTARVSDDNESRGPLVGALLGLLVVTGAGGIGMSILSLVFYRVLTSRGVAVDQLYYAVGGSVQFNVYANVWGALTDMLGGYVVAAAAPNVKYSAALLCAIFVLLVSSLSFFLPFPLPNPFWSIAVSFILPVPFCLYGARLYGSRHSGDGQR